MELHKKSTLKYTTRFQEEKENLYPIHEGNIGMYVCGTYSLQQCAKETFVRF